MKETRLSSKSTIAKNMILLYGRTFLLMFISLITSRVILKSLGVVDYGIYTAVAGVVSMLQMIIGPLTGAISRFLTFELGNGNKEKLKRVFESSITIQWIFSIIAVIVLEIVGVWFLNEKMVIPAERMVDANIVLHVSIATLVITIVSAPYNSAIVAHEKMSAFAYIGLLDGALRLLVAYILFVVDHNKLGVYAFLMLAVALIIRMIYTIYCKKHFEECTKLKLGVDKTLFKQMFGYFGWNIIGSASKVLHVQGTNILLNLFGGPIVNTAQGIANQVNSAIGSFIGNFTMALNPSIVKSYAMGEIKYMNNLLHQGARISYLLLLIISFPIIVNTEFIVNLWLGQCPEHTVFFIRLILIDAMIDSLSKTMMMAINATGNIKYYQIIVGGTLLLNIPLSYVLLSFGMPVEITGFVAILLSIIALILRLILLRKQINLDVPLFIKGVLIRCFFTTILAIGLTFILNRLIGEYHLVMLGTVFLICAVSVLLLGITESERNSLMTRINNLLKNKDENKKLL